uniref:Uncharacterized protein n=1 Tax=Branchiostoma floridae TaxID=7739 RepID=C3ZUI4_BRAFL|eukprot:XP_002587812.1 hypothetical protein BRAFLDRAFT_92261 [Branchiostoma floridae]
MGVVAVIFLWCAALLSAPSSAESDQKQAKVVDLLENRILQILEEVYEKEQQQEQQQDFPEGSREIATLGNTGNTAVDGMKQQQDVRERVEDIVTRGNTGTLKREQKTSGDSAIPMAEQASVSNSIKVKKAVPAFVVSAASQIGEKVVNKLGDRIADGVVENHQEKVVNSLQDYFGKQLDNFDEQYKDVLGQTNNLAAGLSKPVEEGSDKEDEDVDVDSLSSPIPRPPRPRVRRRKNTCPDGNEKVKQAITFDLGLSLCASPESIGVESIAAMGEVSERNSSPVVEVDDVEESVLAIPNKHETDEDEFKMEVTPLSSKRSAPSVDLSDNENCSKRKVDNPSDDIESFSELDSPIAANKVSESDVIDDHSSSEESNETYYLDLVFIVSLSKP